jgi:putative NADH-flavin reductase
MRIAVLGASGTVGSPRRCWAVARGHQVIAFARNGANVKAGGNRHDLDVFDGESIKGDLRAESAGWPPSTRDADRLARFPGPFL